MIDKKTTHHVTYNAIYANPIQHYIPKNTHTMEQKSFPNKKKKKKTKNKKQKSKAIFVTLAQTQQSTHTIEQKYFPNKKKKQKTKYKNLKPYLLHWL